MSGVAVTVVEEGLAQATDRLTRLTVLDKHELLDTVGRLAQLQTRRRIRDEKTAPDGTPWKANYRGSSLLHDQGNLHDSIDYRVSGGDVEVGSSLVYAAIHHFGGVIKPKNAKALAFTAGGENFVVQSVTMPARPYLGLSSDNRDEIESVVADFIAEVLQ
ncbi:phage virion morphogenesis protein [Halocynthiibacter styelae]|uniref:Phage virion morphogenesis protein n=1 Tax=Halocynthiibacter styelae TaxID=2761955 RepID=A0A8J7LM44_9RHOB|nr:phage virion morphogenesis protein [Paenihalocynthiibacter styelae]MBI1495399.1 phage virion morphogenesis protein [Paenihalocynthiibacter styelae]